MAVKEMADQELFEKVSAVVIDVLKAKKEDVKPDSKIVEDLGADSLDRVTLLMALEDSFDAEISDEEAEKLNRVQDVIDFIKKKVN